MPVIAKLPVVGVGENTGGPHTGIGRNHYRASPAAPVISVMRSNMALGQVVLRNGRRKLGEVGVGLDGEVVMEMWRRPVAAPAAYPAHLRRVWPGGAYMMSVEGVECAGGLLHPPPGLGSRAPGPGPWCRIVETLHPDGRARDARAAIGGNRSFSKVPGWPHGDFTSQLQPQAGADVAERSIYRLQCKRMAIPACEDAVPGSPRTAAAQLRGRPSARRCNVIGHLATRITALWCELKS